MNKIIKYILCILFFLNISRAFALETGENDIVPPKIKDAPVIDGKMDDKIWNEAYHIKNFVSNVSPSQAQTNTEAFVCYDDKYLYLAVKCHENNIDELKKSRFTSKRDDTVYANDCIQIFIDTKHDHFSCFQFNINAIGTKEDFLCNSSDWNLPAKDWDGIWHSATYMGKNYWSAELAIPFYTLNIAPGDIDTIGINFARTKKTFPGENSCWTCTYGGFHNYSKYGHLQNLKLTPPQISIQNVNWSEYKWGKNDVKFNITNTENRNWNGKLSLYLKDTEDKNLYDYSENIELKANETKQISLPYLCKEPGKYIAVLGINDKDDKAFSPFFSQPCIIPSALNVNSADMLLYKDGTGYIPLKLNTVDLENYLIETELTLNGNPVKKDRIIPKSFKINPRIETKGLSPGIYSLNIKLLNKNDVITVLKRKLEIIESF